MKFVLFVLKYRPYLISAHYIISDTGSPAAMQLTHRPMVLIILDGWGYSETTAYNAIHSARKPVWDHLWDNYPHTLLNASGMDVGLPAMQMGNSETGHMNIGSGRIVDQEFTRITKAIEDGSFFENRVLKDALEAAAQKGRAVHIMGLLSPGGVHNHQEHIFALVEFAAGYDVREIYLHAFLDGRDTPPKSAEEYMDEAYLKMLELGKGRFASVVGRYYAMDRNKHWDRTRAAYKLITAAEAEYESVDAFIAVDMAYSRGETDEFVKPTVIVQRDGSAARVESGDVVIFSNYRADRARQLAEAFTARDFDGFPRGRPIDLAAFISMTEYRSDFDFPVLFPPVQLRNVLGEYLANSGMTQLRIAETEKYAHVTFFFNGGEERTFKDEDRILVPSPRVATYDLYPKMSAPEVTEHLTAAIAEEKHDVIICNFANADMVGHTGNFDATVKAIETIDTCLGKIVEQTRRVGGEILITSDHGNAEQMRSFITEKIREQAHTAHTNNLVPLIYVGRPAEVAPSTTAALCDVVPTMLYVMGMEKPEEMTGTPLFRLC